MFELSCHGSALQIGLSAELIAECFRKRNLNNISRGCAFDHLFGHGNKTFIKSRAPKQMVAMPKWVTRRLGQHENFSKGLKADRSVVTYVGPMQPPTQTMKASVCATGGKGDLS